MTDKELHKLGRRELLQLLLAQAKEAEEAKQALKETQQKLSELEEGYERLKHRLDDKDIRILKLRNALREQIEDKDPSGARPSAELSELLELPPMAEGRYPEQEEGKPAAEGAKEKPMKEEKEEKPEEEAPGQPEDPPDASADPIQMVEVVQVIGGRMQPKSQIALQKKMANQR